jgi:hypothetical protein
VSDCPNLFKAKYENENREGKVSFMNRSPDNVQK